MARGRRRPRVLREEEQRALCSQFDTRYIREMVKRKALKAGINDAEIVKLTNQWDSGRQFKAGLKRQQIGWPEIQPALGPLQTTIELPGNISGTSGSMTIATIPVITIGCDNTPPNIRTISFRMNQTSNKETPRGVS